MSPPHISPSIEELLGDLLGWARHGGDVPWNLQPGLGRRAMLLRRWACVL